MPHRVAASANNMAVILMYFLIFCYLLQTFAHPTEAKSKEYTMKEQKNA